MCYERLEGCVMNRLNEGVVNTSKGYDIHISEGFT